MGALTRSIPRQWKCGECCSLHNSEDGAIDCCPVKITEVYVCPVCDEDHEEETDALSCCPHPEADPDADPLEIPRGPTGSELEALGQLRLIP